MNYAKMTKAQLIELLKNVQAELDTAHKDASTASSEAMECMLFADAFEAELTEANARADAAESSKADAVYKARNDAFTAAERDFTARLDAIAASYDERLTAAVNAAVATALKQANDAQAARLEAAKASAPKREAARREASEAKRNASKAKRKSNYKPLASFEDIRECRAALDALGYEYTMSDIAIWVEAPASGKKAGTLKALGFSDAKKRRPQGKPSYFRRATKELGSLK